MRRVCTSARESGSTPATCLIESIRLVVQSSTMPSPDIFAQYKTFEKRRQLRLNRGGNYYRHRQKLWPSTESLERELTVNLYAPIETTPVEQLVPALADHNTKPLLPPSSESGGDPVIHQALPRLQQASTTTNPRGWRTAVAEYETDEGDIVCEPRSNSAADGGQASAVTHNDETLSSKMLSDTNRDLRETPLASAGTDAWSTISAMMMNVEADIPSSSATSIPRARGSCAPARGGVAWSTLSTILDPEMQQVAVRVTASATATRSQTRLLRTLLHEDHQDVIFNPGSAGDGMTTAMLLALLQSIRNEDTGVNVLVVENAMEAKRALDLAVSMCGERGGRLVDRNSSDLNSWVLLAPFREAAAAYYQRLKRNHNPSSERTASVRLVITTADVLCELLFERKLEFEHLGYLRRLYVDRCDRQLQLLPADAPTSLVNARLRDPVAVELLLGTLHQLPSPHIRSVMQIACVGSGSIDETCRKHLEALCTKPDHTAVVLSVPQMPSTVHVMYQFYRQLVEGRALWQYLSRHGLNGSNSMTTGLSEAQVVRYAHLVVQLRRAAATIPGRVVICVSNDEDVLLVKNFLRRLGMDAKLFSEVISGASAWKFVVVREAEGAGVGLEMVSHVVVTFAPKSHHHLMHLAKRAEPPSVSKRNLSWLWVMTDMTDAKKCQEVATAVGIDFESSVLQPSGGQILHNAAAELMAPEEVRRMVRAPSLYGMDPQYAVQQHWEHMSDNVDMAHIKREIFSKPHPMHFYREDYTPVPELSRRHKQAKRLAKDFEADPSGTAARLQRNGFVDQNFKPTNRLRRSM